MTKLIAVEEHFLTAEIRAAWASSTIGQEGTAAFDRGEIETRLEDLGAGRIALMDESGVDVQVLSLTTPALHNLEPEQSVIVARHTNDLVAATIAKHPARFQGFATLPTAAPAEAALEFERSVRHLGLGGAMLCGRTRDKNLDHPDFRPLLNAAAMLHVPVFVHPQIPQRAVREVYYSGFADPIDTAFATFGLGWHYEAGIQFLRMMLAGIFDESPDLQIILGHCGEVVLFYIERLAALGRIAKLQKPGAFCSTALSCVLSAELRASCPHTSRLTSHLSQPGPPPALMPGGCCGRCFGRMHSPTSRQYSIASSRSAANIKRASVMR